MASGLRLCAMRSVGGCLKEASSIATATAGVDGGQAARLEEVINRLDEEKRKIEAFKREFPLSVRLLRDVIEGLNREVDRCRGEKIGIVFEALKKSKVAEDGGEESERDCKDKKNWMSSAQLWSDNYSENNDDFKNDDNVISQEVQTKSFHKKKKIVRLCSDFAHSKKRKGIAGGTEKATCSWSTQAGTAGVRSCHLKASRRTARRNSSLSCRCTRRRSTRSFPMSRLPPTTTVPVTVALKLRSYCRSNLQPAQDLLLVCSSHRGSRQGAGPKSFIAASCSPYNSSAALKWQLPNMIRQQMEVDGLTNDEVKCHLQLPQLNHSPAAMVLRKKVNPKALAGDELNLQPFMARQSWLERPFDEFSLDLKTS